MLDFDEIEDCFPEEGVRISVNAQWLHDFAHAVAAKEREACAKVCDARAEMCSAKAEMVEDQDDRTELNANAWQFSVLAAEIRKRSNAGGKP